MTPAAQLPGTGILAVHAHPDDETLTHGATLALWARAGQPVTLVTCTRGEQGEVIPPELKHLEGDGPALAAVREQELSAAVRALGVTSQFFLDQLPLIKDDAPPHPDQPAPGAPTRYEDSGMVWLAHGAAGPATQAPSSLTAADLEVAAQRLAELIRQTQPRFVLTYEPGGGYGHPDHVRAREIAVRGGQIAADANWESDAAPWRVPAVLGSVLPAAILRAGRTELAQRHGAGQIPGTEHLQAETATDGLPALAREDAANVLEVDVSAAQVLAAREAALRAHHTQVQAVRTFPPQLAAPYLAGAYGLSNNYYSPLFGRDFYLPDPDWSHAPLTSADLLPPTP